MSTKLPTISVTAEHYSQSESSDDDDDDSYSNDMDYNRNAGGVTDIEDFDSQGEVDKPRSRRSSTGKVNSLDPNNIPHNENDVTDIEDYNDSDSDDEDEKSNVYPELKMSLQEFLQHGLQEQAAVNDEMKEKIEVRAGNFLQAQNLNGIADYLTDCEDYNTDSEIDYDEKSVCVDLDAAVNDQGKVCITDGTRPAKSDGDDSDEYEDVSVLSDISDLASALSDVTSVGVRGMSEDELLEMSADEEICQIAYSGSSSEAEDEHTSEDASNASLPEIDVAFINANGKQRKNSTATMTNKKNFLSVSATNEEVLTDVERLDDSTAEDDDGFDNEEESEQPIPRAVILATGDDGACLTDVEDMFCEDKDILLSSTDSEVQSVAAQIIPPPHREVIELKEDIYGDTITNVMPMGNEFQFGIYNNFKDEGLTDSEDYSCTEDYERKCSIAEELLAANNYIEGEVTVANEVLKPLLNKRVELHSNAESVTDVEEIYVDGTNRRKKLKTRSMSKGKSKYLDVAKPKEEGGTDVEDMDLSECGLPPNVIRNAVGEQPQEREVSDKVTDIEDITVDEISDVSEADAPQIDENIFSLKQYIVNSANVVVTLERDANIKCVNKCAQHNACKPHLQTWQHRLREDEPNQHNTDIEDVQLPSDIEECCDMVKETNCTCSELNDMLNESYTVVHEKTGSGFNAEAETLHIKGMRPEANTDIEYVESDESAARGGN